MASRNYTGVQGKSVWDAKNFNKGVRYTNESLREGTLAMLTNLQISGSGGSLLPRHPYINALFSIVNVHEEGEAPIAFSKDTILHKPIQQDGKEYFITLNHKRTKNTIEEIELTEDNYYVVDGDTIVINNITYRLLGIDTPEMSTPGGTSAKEFTQGWFDAWYHYKVGEDEIPTVLVVYDKNNPTATDMFGRRLVWIAIPGSVTTRNSWWYIPYDLDGVRYDGEMYYGAPDEIQYNEVTNLLYSPDDYKVSSWGEGLSYLNANYAYEDLDPTPESPSNYWDWWACLEDSENPGYYYYYYFNYSIYVSKPTLNHALFTSGNAKPMGYFAEERPELLGLPIYDYEDMSQWAQSGWSWNNEVEFIEVEQYPAIFSKSEHTILRPYKEDVDATKIPYIDVREEHYFNTSAISKDLGLSEGHPLKIEFLSEYVGKETDDMIIKTELRSITLMPFFDGYLFIGRVVDRDEVLYEGPMSINYEVPLADNGFDVDWERSFFRFRSYKTDIYELSYENLASTSPNLLQGGTIKTDSYFGEEAKDEGFNFPIIRSILVRESGQNPTKVFSQLESGKEYFIHPLVAIPPMDVFNGLGTYEPKYSGYVYRWVVTNLSGSPSEAEALKELSWQRTGNFDSSPGTYPITPGSSCSVESELQATNLVQQRLETVLANSNKVEYDEGEILRGITPQTSQDVINGFSEDTRVVKVTEFFTNPKTPTDPGIPLYPIPLLSMNVPKGTSLNTAARVDYSPYGFTHLKDYLDAFGFVELNIGEEDDWDLLDPLSFSNPMKLVRVSRYFSWGSQYQWYLPNQIVEYLKVQKILINEYPQYTCTESNIVSKLAWVKGFDREGMHLENGLSDWVLRTTSSRFSKSPRGIQVQLQISPYTENSEGDIIESEEDLERMAYTYSSETYLYEEEEREIPLERDNTVIYSCTQISTFGDRVVLYGSNRFKNILYLSGVLGFKGITSPLGYFPLRYALDQFDSPIVHVEPYGETLIVFTVKDIWVVKNTPYEYAEDLYEDRYYAKKIIHNISIEEHNKNTVKVVNNYLIFLSNSTLYAVRPNLYVEAEDNLQLVVLSDNINNLLKNPVDFLFKRLRHRNLLFLKQGEVKPTVDTYLSVHNNIIKLFLSMYIEEHDLPYMIECEFDMEKARWTIHDNVACSFPIQSGVFDSTEGPFYLMKNHPVLDFGLTYMKREGVNNWDFAEPYGKRLDIKSVKVTEDGSEKHFVFNSVSSEDFEEIKKVKQPINCLIDTGNIAATNQLQKRVSQVHLELSNIDASVVPINIDFYIDGHTRQTSNTVALQETVTGYIKMIEKTILNDYNIGEEDPLPQDLPDMTTEDLEDAILTVLNDEAIAGDIQFSNWILDISRFSPSHRLLTRFGVSGRGRVPRAEFIFEVSDKIEIFRYAFIFKEQSGR